MTVWLSTGDTLTREGVGKWEFQHYYIYTMVRNVSILKMKNIRSLISWVYHFFGLCVPSSNSSHLVKQSYCALTSDSV